MTHLARHPERLRQVGRPEEDDVDAVDRGDLVHLSDGARRLDLDDDEGLLVGLADVFAQRTALPVSGRPRIGQAALAARLVLDGAHRGVGIGRVANPGHVAPLHPGVQEPQDQVRLIGGHADHRSHVEQLGRAHEVLALPRLERAVLAIENDEIPALVGNDLNERRIGKPHPNPKNRLAVAQRALGEIVSHQPSRIPPNEARLEPLKPITRGLARPGGV